MTDTATPKPRAARKPSGEIAVEYREIAVPHGRSLKIPYVGEAPEVQVLGVTQREGRGFGVFDDVYRVVLVWRR